VRPRKAATGEMQPRARKHHEPLHRLGVAAVDTEHAKMADGDIRVQVYVKVTPAEGEEFKVRFDFGGNPRQGVDIYCTRNLSQADKQRLENLVTDFVGSIVIIFKVQ
jgi:hypothetical protein